MRTGVIGPALLHAAALDARGWSFEPGIVAPLILVGLLYGRGVRMLGGIKRTPGARYFIGGWLVLAFGLLSPLHAASDELFSAHMIQHELLMIVAAPLFALSRPLPVLLDGVPKMWRAHVDAMSGRSSVRRVWRTATRPLDAWLIHGTIIWVWHIPALFQATLVNDAVHAAQHISFFATGYLFWTSLADDDAPERGGVAVLSLFTTAVHTGVLGALITFARRLWYPAYATRASAWHLTALADQQLAGLIMWIPASVVYLIAALVVMRRWLHDSESTVSRRGLEAVGPAAR